jgi:hypothetical protein
MRILRSIASVVDDDMKCDAMDRLRRAVPILPLSAIKPPLLVCVALDRTGTVR